MTNEPILTTHRPCPTCSKPWVECGCALTPSQQREEEIRRRHAGPSKARFVIDDDDTVDGFGSVDVRMRCMWCNFGLVGMLTAKQADSKRERIALLDKLVTWALEHKPKCDGRPV